MADHIIRIAAHKGLFAVEHQISVHDAVMLQGLPDGFFINPLQRAFGIKDPAGLGNKFGFLFPSGHGVKGHVLLLGPKRPGVVEQRLLPRPVHIRSLGLEDPVILITVAKDHKAFCPLERIISPADVQNMIFVVCLHINPEIILSAVSRVLGVGGLGQAVGRDFLFLEASFHNLKGLGAFDVSDLINDLSRAVVDGIGISVGAGAGLELSLVIHNVHDQGLAAKHFFPASVIILNARIDPDLFD